MSEVQLDTASLREDTRAVTAVDFEAEVRLLAACFHDSSLLDDATEKIAPEDFGHYAHELTFAAMVACDGSGRPVDVVTVADELTRAGSIKQVGGLDGLRMTAAAAAQTADEAEQRVAAAVTDFAAYLDIVVDRSTRRRLMAAARKISVEASSGETEATALVDSAEQAVFAVSASRGNESSTQTMPQVVADIHDRMAKARTQQLVGYSTGFARIDQVTGGLQPGQMVTIAGRPGTGKSSLAAQIARHIAETNDVLVPILSYEMQAAEIGMRLLSSASGVDLSELMRGQVPDEMDGIVAREAEKMAQLRLLIDDNPPSTITGVRSMLRRLARRAPLGALVLDYMQLVGGPVGSRGSDNREAEVAFNSRNIKAMATELKVPVLALSQLNRSLESRPNKRPLLSDLRESGSIEQDSSIVIFVYRHHLYDPTAPEHEAELIVAKNRNGPAPVTAYVDWEGRCTRFRDSDRRGPDDGFAGGAGGPAGRGNDGWGGGQQPAGGGGYGFSGVDPFGY